MIRPLHDWILVEMDPIETTLGSIIIPEGLDHRKATVLATGPGKELKTGLREPTGVVVGDRVIFNRAHGEHGQGKAIRSELGGGKLLIKPADILFAYQGHLVVE